MSSFFFNRGSNQALKNLGLIKVGSEYAPGIPDKGKVVPLPDIRKPTEWDVSIQEHDAERAGKHYDLRLVDPETGHAHSWAIPKAALPEPGKPLLALEQPTHTKDYALNFGRKKPERIESGYGKGVVKIKYLDKADVYHAKPEEEGTRLRFNLYKSTGPEEYALVRTQSGKDLLVNKTQTAARLPHLSIGKKEKTKAKALDSLVLNNTDEILMPKYDGAYTFLDLNQTNRIPRLFSYRKPIKHKAGVIEHTHKVPLLLKTRTPKELKGTTLIAETIGVTNDTGKALEAKDIAGMLNATVPVSRQRQKEFNAKLMPIATDIIRYKGKSVEDLPYAARYELLKEIQKTLKIPITEVALTADEKEKLLKNIQDGKHPYTSEGVILRPLNVSQAATKFKFRPDFDVYIRKINPAIGKEGKKLDRAGNFEYSWTPGGAIAGRIGTGFSHEFAKQMHRHPDQFIGRVAKVYAEKQFRSGALSKPSFKELHIDKGKV